MQSSSKQLNQNIDNNLLDFFPNNELIDISGNHPLIISDKKLFWLVKQGAVDIFCLKYENGIIKSARRYVCSAVKDEIIVSFDEDLNNCGLRYLAIGEQGSQLVQITETEIEKLLENEKFFDGFSFALNNWIKKLGLTIEEKKTVPPDYKVLTPEETLSVNKDSYLYTPKKNVCVNFISGEAILCDETIDNKVKPNKNFIIPKRYWLNCTLDSKLNIIDIRSLIKEKSFFDDLNLFQNTISQLINDRFYKKLKRDETHIINQDKENEKNFKTALSTLGRVIYKKEDDLLYNVDELDALYKSCHIVARKAGIKFIIPQKTKSKVTVFDIAKDSHFSTRKVSLEDNWWKKDIGPLLAFTDDDKPVALIPKNAKNYYIIDPLTDKKQIVTEKIANNLKEEAYIFYRPFPAKALTFTDLVKFVSNSILKDILIIFLVGAGGALLALLIPIMTGVIIDTIIPFAERVELWQMFMLLMISVLSIALFDITRSVAMVRVEGRMDACLQAGIIERLFALPVEFFRKYSAGDLANRAMGFNRIRSILSGVILTSIMTCIFSIFNLLLLFWYDWKLALVAISFTILAIIITGVLSFWMVKYQRLIFRSGGRLAGVTLQYITGIIKIRLTGSEDRAFSQWAKIFNIKQKNSYLVNRIQAALNAITTIIPVLATVILFWCYLRLRVTDMSTGNFLAFYTAFTTFLTAFVQMTLVGANVFFIIPLMERARPILANVPEYDDSKGKVDYLTGKISVNHLRFRYSAKTDLILKDVSIEANPGEYVAIVGGSGSGKSTLLHLLLGFDKPEAGAIFYDNYNLKDTDVRDVRKQMGVVLQNSHIMPGTIFENIIGTSNLTLDDAWEAARMVGLDEDVKAMPMQMYTYLSAGGGTLSGGQVQRILIARAIVHKPSILFFDEATSALDNRTQKIVSDSIDKLHVTRIAIAHRLSTIINADRIYVLKDGVMSESGTYEELMKNKSFFYELAKRQIS